MIREHSGFFEKYPELTSESFLIRLFSTMLKIRKFEENVSDLVEKKEINCPCHLYTGQEAVATGVCAGLHDDDWVFSTHRSHGHYIAKSGEVNHLMAELYGKQTGCSHGRGGSMHLAFPEKGLPGSSAIVAGTIAPAVGAALAFSFQKSDRVAVVFFGEGATNEGVFYEALNFASLKKLPIIFVCENNLYASHMKISSVCANTKIFQIARALNIPSVRIDGNDVIRVYESAIEYINRARSGEGPCFIECMTYRWKGHVGPNFDLDLGLRSKEEFDRWMKKCPIRRFEKMLVKNNFLSVQKKFQIESDVAREIESCIQFAKSSPFPDSSTIPSQ